MDKTPIRMIEDSVERLRGLRELGEHEEQAIKKIEDALAAMEKKIDRESEIEAAITIRGKPNDNVSQIPGALEALSQSMRDAMTDGQPREMVLRRHLLDT